METRRHRRRVRRDARPRPRSGGDTRPTGAATWPNPGTGRWTPVSIPRPRRPKGEIIPIVGRLQPVRVDGKLFVAAHIERDDSPPARPRLRSPYASGILRKGPEALE